MSMLHEDLLVTALEGGSNYWYSIRDLESIGIIMEALPPSVKLYKAVMQEGLELEVYDIEDEDEKLGVISKERILSALGEMKDKAPEDYQNIIDDVWDAESADVWFQFVVMGEVVYG